MARRRVPCPRGRFDPATRRGPAAADRTNLQLGTNGTVYIDAYAIMMLTDASSTVTFYQDEISVDDNNNLVLNDSVVLVVE